MSAKNKIMDVVEELCAQIGPLRLKHTTVATKLGIKPPSLYAHYPSMDAILAATAERALSEIAKIYIDINIDNIDPVDALNLIQSQQVDLLVARPGIARLVLFDLSQPGGLKSIDWAMPQVIQITQMERLLFEKAVTIKLIPEQDFEFWHSTRMGSLYVALSYEWLQDRPTSAKRITALKQHLQISTPIC